MIRLPVEEGYDILAVDPARPIAQVVSAHSAFEPILLLGGLQQSVSWFAGAVKPLVVVSATVLLSSSIQASIVLVASLYEGRGCGCSAGSSWC